MFVSTFLGEVDIGLITHEQLMTAIAQTDGAGISLVTIAHHNAMKMATDKHRYGVCGTIRQAGIEQTLLIAVLQPGRHVTPVSHTIGTS